MKTLEIDVVGTIWLPPISRAQTYHISEHDCNRLWGKPKFSDFSHEEMLENLENWINTHTGDFQSIESWRATYHKVIHSMGGYQRILGG